MTSKAASAGVAATTSANSMRFMQLALASAMLFSVMYMWQFMAASVAPSDAASVAVVDGGAAAGGDTGVIHRDRVLAHTQYVVQGFEEAHKFVREYNVETQGPLFMLFMSDANENGTYWHPDCEKAKQPIYDTFKRSPRGSRIVEVRIGLEPFWADMMNPFRQNQLFYIDFIPTVMRYEGGGNSTALLAGPYCRDINLLEYVFRVNKPAAGEPHANRVYNLHTPQQVLDYTALYDNSYPLFIFFISGVHFFNGRLWCPFCDKADVAVMHYFNYTAPESAVLLRTVVATHSREWFEEYNPFVSQEFADRFLEFDGVPYLGFVTKNGSEMKPIVTEYASAYEDKSKLQQFFLQQPPAKP